MTVYLIKLVIPHGVISVEVGIYNIAGLIGQFLNKTFKIANTKTWWYSNLTPNGTRYLG